MTLLYLPVEHGEAAEALWGASSHLKETSGRSMDIDGNLLCPYSNDVVVVPFELASGRSEASTRPVLVTCYLRSQYRTV